MSADRPRLPAEVPVWVCLTCSWATTKPRPTKGRGGHSAQGRHKVYDGPRPRWHGEISAKLGSSRWCGPVVQWVARPPAGDCEHCGGSGWLLIERVVSLDELASDEQPPYWSPCHACPAGRALS